MKIQVGPETLRLGGLQKRASAAFISRLLNNLVLFFFLPRLLIESSLSVLNLLVLRNAPKTAAVLVLRKVPRTAFADLLGHSFGIQLSV